MDVNLRDAWDAVPLYYACRSGKRFARHCQQIGMHDGYDQSGTTKVAELGSQQATVDDSLLLHYTLLQLHHKSANLRGMLLAVDYSGHEQVSQRQHPELQLACLAKQPTAWRAHL